jgi:RNA polymerase sigma-70 factor (ECF subfamily)
MERMEAVDAADVDRARAGDEEAFRALVERHSRALFRLAFRMTGNEHDAEDVVQEAFLKAYRRLGQFESRARFGSWLYRIAANCALDLLRVRARRDEASLDGPADPEAVPWEPAAAAPGPERVVFGAEVRRKVARTMSRLSPLERAAFVLRHHEGLSIAEIGEALGLDTNATKHSIFRAVRKMREALGPLLQGAS